jgi:hypothetical protein
MSTSKSLSLRENADSTKREAAPAAQPARYGHSHMETAEIGPGCLQRQKLAKNLGDVMVGEPLFTKKLANSSVVDKFASFWQCVLRFGIPFVILFNGIDYAVFRIGTGNSGLKYHWELSVESSIPVMFVVSTLWWLLMREIAAWRKKNRES